MPEGARSLAVFIDFENLALGFQGRRDRFDIDDQRRILGAGADEAQPADRRLSPGSRALHDHGG